LFTPRRSFDIRLESLKKTTNSLSYESQHYVRDSKRVESTSAFKSLGHYSYTTQCAYVWPIKSGYVSQILQSEITCVFLCILKVQAYNSEKEQRNFTRVPAVINKIVSKVRSTIFQCACQLIMLEFYKKYINYVPEFHAATRFHCILNIQRKIILIVFLSLRYSGIYSASRSPSKA
jgi:hypothetical protein